MPGDQVEKVSASRNRFKNVMDELDYLSEKVRHWWFQKNRPAKARVFAKRFGKLLKEMPNSEGTLLWEEYWGLLYEVLGPPELAIHHHRREVDMIRRLLKDGSPVAYYDYEYLADSLVHLACLQLDEDQIQPARKALLEAQSLAKRHGFAFEAEDLLEETTPKPRLSMNGKRR